MYFYNMTKVSVIVPVYNVEKYLSRCLDSIISQTYNNLEIICVNDGSTDSSLNILTHYQKFDSRIKIIYKENGGLSSARNAGVNASTGKYILFVDADDYISQIAVEKLYENAEKNNSDVVIFDYISGELDLLSKKFMNQFHFLSEYKNKSFNVSTLGFNGYKFTSPTAWSKLYRSEFIKGKISFCEGLIYEDNSYWAEVYLSAHRISYLPMALYYYVTNRPGCIMLSLGKDVFDIFKVQEYIEKSFSKHGLYDKYKDEIDLLKILNYLRNYFRIEPQLKEAFYKRILAENIQLNYDKYLNGDYMDFEKRYVRCFKKMNELSYADFKNIRLEEIK